jgi:hypothetical protein
VIDIVIPRPMGLEFVEWGTLVSEQLAAYHVPAPANNEAWREWAQNLFYEPILGFAPQPYGFDNWLDWARAFRDTFS